MTGSHHPDHLSAADALELVACRRDRLEPRSALAGFFQRVPTTLERWNSISGVVQLVEREESPDGVPVVVAQRVDGTPLGDLVSRAHVLGVAQAVRLAIGLGEILESLHSVGLTHGHVRTDTVLVAGDDQVRVLPPPFAILAERAHHPRIRELERADLHAFGAVLYELLAGAGPRHHDGASALEAGPVPIGKRRRGIAPPLERLVMETLTSDRAHLDMSEVVNRLWIERERLRVGNARPDASHLTGELRRLVAVAVVATCVTLGWLGTARSPVPPAPPSRQAVPADVGSPVIAAPPALPAGTPAREAPAIAAVSEPVVAAPARAPASARIRERATPRPAPAGPAPRREVVERIAIEPPPPPPEPPMATAAAPSRAAALPPTEVTGGKGAGEAVGLTASPKPILTARERAGDRVEAVPTLPLPQTTREGEMPKRVPLEVQPEVAVAPMPPPAPPDIPLAASVMLVRGAPEAGAEVGASALSTGYGASGAGGIIEGRRGPAMRSVERPPGADLAARFSGGPSFPPSPGR